MHLKCLAHGAGHTAGDLWWETAGITTLTRIMWNAEGLWPAEGRCVGGML